MLLLLWLQRFLPAGQGAGSGRRPTGARTRSPLQYGRNARFHAPNGEPSGVSTAGPKASKSSAAGQAALERPPQLTLIERRAAVGGPAVASGPGGPAVEQAGAGRQEGGEFKSESCSVDLQKMQGQREKMVFLLRSWTTRGQHDPSFAILCRSRRQAARWMRWLGATAPAKVWVKETDEWVWPHEAGQ